MRWPRQKVIPYMIAALVAGAIAYAFVPGPVPVDLAPAVKGPLRVTVDEDGKTRIKERYTVTAPLSGRMLRVELHPGDRVKAGKTLLFAIEPTDPALLDVRSRTEAEARVKAAEASKAVAAAKLDRARQVLELATHDFERARQLLASKAMTREDYDNAEHKERMARDELRTAQFGVQVATFEVDIARAALVQTRPGASRENGNGRFDVHTPIDGSVLRVPQESAGPVTAGTKIIELGDPTDLEVEVDVLSADAVKVTPGAKVLFEHWGGDEPLHGRVRLVEPAGFLKVSALGVEEQRVNVIVDLTDPLEKRRTLGDAYRVEARIVVWEGDEVLKVPAGAVFRQDVGWAVFRSGGGKAQWCSVRVGRTNGLETEILEGLEAGDKVIVHPSDRIKDGVRVSPRTR